ncbi:MAG: nitrous oxide reductase family maturation protein NosD [Deltaproteobacteria bacterium]|nr:nitrous oxide reductase family maturation protein NosD [Deltaproteobacteria bacterium]
MRAPERRPSPRALTALAMVAAAGGLLGGGTARASSDSSTWTRATPARPAGCQEVATGSDLQPVIDQAAEGSALCLARGEYTGPVRVPRAITLFGPAGAVVRSTGRGTTIRLDAPGSRLLGLTVEGSGARLDTLDAAVHVGGDHAEVIGIGVRGATFGILVEKARGVLISGNEVLGPEGASLGQRGDGIRLWETHGSTLTGNRVAGARDVVVWYSSGTLFKNNLVEHGRYGTHLMYSHGCVIDSNRYMDNVVGVFLMYSRHVRLTGNVLAGSSGGAGIGVGIKECGNLHVQKNRLVRNTTGVYIDTSPLYPEDHNIFEENSFLLGGTAVLFHKSESRNRFARNSMRDNRSQVTVEGGGDARGVIWEGNEFDDYAGYDFDGDGVGDIPYELRSLSADLISRNPNLEFLRGTPALFLVDVISRALPLFDPKTILVDPHPRIGRRRAAGGEGGDEG